MSDSEIDNILSEELDYSVDKPSDEVTPAPPSGKYIMISRTNLCISSLMITFGQKMN